MQREEICICCGEKTPQYPKYMKFNYAEQKAVVREILESPYPNVPSSPLNDTQTAWECSACKCMNPNEPGNNADIHIAHFFRKC